MPQSITIPSSIDDAVETLTGVGELITASKWTRAAIVAAFVRLSPGRGQAPQHTRLPNGESTISVEEFAAKNIYGLTGPQAVRKYVQAWLDANGGKYPKPGATRRLPNTNFPPVDANLGSRVSVDPTRAVEQIVRAHGPEAVAEAIEDVTPLRQAVTRTRLNRVTTAEQRRQLRERTREREERMNAASDRMFTRLEHTGLVDHEAWLKVRQARMWLRKAVAEFERNPVFTAEQRADLDLALAECVHMIELLSGTADEWSADDREFLDAVGVES